MSISIIDYIGNFIYQETLPKSSATIIICQENTAVPDALKANLLLDLDTSIILKGGCFVYRAGTEFNSGCCLGKLYSALPDAKVFTPRREVFTSIIPIQNLEFLNLPVSRAAKSSSNVSTSEDNSSSQKYSEIYYEVLNKFSRTFLLDCSIRAVKFKSLRAQAKNIADGVIISYSRKMGKVQISNSESLVDSIFEDLEREGVININLGCVEYNEVLIEAFFGYGKTKIFNPGFKLKESPRLISEPKLNTQFSDQKDQVFANNSPLFSCTQNSNQLQPSPDLGFFKPSTCIFNPYQNKPNTTAQPNLIPSTQIKLPLSLISNTQMEPSLNLKPALIDQVSIVTPCENEDSSKNITPNGEEWEYHESAITDLIIEGVSQKSDIDSCLKLFRYCNGVSRDYFRARNIDLAEERRAAITKNCLKIALLTFFKVESTTDLGIIAENISIYGLTKLTKL